MRVLVEMLEDVIEGDVIEGNCSMVSAVDLISMLSSQCAVTMGSAFASMAGW